MNASAKTKNQESARTLHFTHTHNVLVQCRLNQTKTVSLCHTAQNTFNRENDNSFKYILKLSLSIEIYKLLILINT